ncbi:hypothetical protein D3C80_898500 [compost metagenome]
MQQAGVGDKFHARRFGRIDNILVLRFTLADFAGRDQQQFFHALQRRSERRLVGVIRLTHGDALFAQRISFCRITHDCHNLTGRNGFQQVFDNALAKLAGSAGNRDHEELLRVCLVLWHTITQTNL